MMPFPNEETTPPVTKMYFVSATIVNILLDLIIEYERVTRSIKDVAKLAYFYEMYNKNKNYCYLCNVKTI